MCSNFQKEGFWKCNWPWVFLSTETHTLALVAKPQNSQSFPWKKMRSCKWLTPESGISPKWACTRYIAKLFSFNRAFATVKAPFAIVCHRTGSKRQRIILHKVHTHAAKHRFLPSHLAWTSHFICQAFENLWSTVDDIFSLFMNMSAKKTRLRMGFASSCVVRGNEVKQDCVLLSVDWKNCPSGCFSM